MDAARCTFEIVSWKEEAYGDAEAGPRLSRASVTQTWAGAIEGTGAVEYLMSYAADGTAAFVGLERITGAVAGRTGSIVLRHVGSFEGGKARSTFEVLAGRGRGDLAALGGEGTFEAGHGEPAKVEVRFRSEG